MHDLAFVKFNDQAEMIEFNQSFEALDLNTASIKTLYALAHRDPQNAFFQGYLYTQRAWLRHLRGQRLAAHRCSLVDCTEITAEGILQGWEAAASLQAGSDWPRSPSQWASWTEIASVPWVWDIADAWPKTMDKTQRYWPWVLKLLQQAAEQHTWSRLLLRAWPSQKEAQCEMVLPAQLHVLDALTCDVAQRRPEQHALVLLWAMSVHHGGHLHCEHHPHGTVVQVSWPL